MDIKKSCASIIEYVGGSANVESAAHCATRLRFNLKDFSKADLNKLGSVEGVLTAQNKGGQLQVVIGTNVEKFYNEILKSNTDINAGGSVDAEKEENGSKKKLSLNSFIETIASLFTPILPALVGCGMIQAILKIVVQLGMSNTSPTYLTLNMMGQLVFYFLPFLLAYTSAEKFKTNKSMAMLLAGAYIYFTLNSGTTEFGFLGLSFKAVSYTSTVIPVIFSVFVLKYVYSFVDRIIPDMLKVVLVPMIVLLIMVPLELAILGPIGSYIGTYIAAGVEALFNFSGLIAGALLGFFRPILVMFGMHYSIMPIQIQQVADTGKTAMIVSALCANIAQAGAALGVALKTKNKSMKTAGFSASVTALFGVTEPAIYGVTLRYKKPFFCACAMAAITSGILGLLGSYATAIALPGILAVGTYECNAGFIWIPIMLIVAFVGTAAATYIIGFDDSKA